LTREAWGRRFQALGSRLKSWLLCCITAATGGDAYPNRLAYCLRQFGLQWVAKGKWRIWSIYSAIVALYLLQCLHYIFSPTVASWCSLAIILRLMYTLSM
jgi:hypothetical protein